MTNQRSLILGAVILIFLTASTFFATKLGFHGIKAVPAGIMLLVFFGVLGTLSFIAGALIVPEKSPHWLRLLVGFSAIMFIGTIIQRLGVSH